MSVDYVVYVGSYIRIQEPLIEVETENSFCNKCGKSKSTSYVFCPECGLKLGFVKKQIIE